MEKLKRNKGKAIVGRKVEKSSLSQFSVHMNSVYNDQHLIDNFGKAYKDRKTFENEHGSLYASPFQCCQLNNLISDQLFLENLQEELLDQIFYDKNNDLYKFHQTNDLRKISTPHIDAIRKFFADEFRAWISAVTGIVFTDRVDLTSSKYEYTDVLLCHDDELDTRRIAFAFYLVPAWSKDDGGLLELFDMDGRGQPKDVVASLIPEWNSVAWFEVTEASHHQVSEVLAKTKTRLSVHGWFHTAPIPRSPRYVEPLRALASPVHIEEEMVYEWLNPIYLDPEVQLQVREKFEEDSEIELKGFLKEEKYQELADSLTSNKICWQKYGPPNKRNYQVLADDDSLPDVIRQCIEFLRSEAVFLVLSNLTGLRLHRLAPLSQSDDDEDCEEEEEDDDDDDEADGGDKGQKSVKASSSSRDRNNVVDSDSSKSSAECVESKRRRLGSDSRNLEKADTATAPDDTVEDDWVQFVLAFLFTHDLVTLPNAECDAKCRYEVRKWQHGDYTLVHDTDLGNSEFALDAVLYCLCKGWQKDFGGYTSYIAKGEDEELLTVYPDENSLALVYRDKDTLKFVKHVNHRATESAASTEFCDIAFVYYE